MFVIVILKEGSGKAELDYWEKRFIKYRDTKSPNGYNLTEGGEGLNGIKYSPKTCSKISATQRKETPFKNLIKEIDRCQLTYTVLSKLMNLPRQTLYCKMHGKKKFTETEWAKLAEILGKPAEYLMIRDDEKPSVSKRHCSPYKNLIWEIDRRKLTYTALGKLLNLPYPNISAKMNGVCNFTLTEWTKLSEIFGKSFEYLMARCDGLLAITSKADKNSKISVARRKDTPFKNLLTKWTNGKFLTVLLRSF